MRLFGRRVACLTAVAITVAAVPASAVPASAVPAAGTAPPARMATGGQSGFREITLVTGDRLSVATDGSNRVAVRPAAGREHVRFLRRSGAGHHWVIPTDALRLIDLGRLDRRLFDVTTLLAYRYDDARRAELPLIVSYTGGAGVRASALPGVTGTRELPAVDGAAVTVPRRAAGAFWNSVATEAAGVRTMRAGLGRIWLDGWRQPALDVSVPQIGAPAAWQAGYTGRDVPVAVLDTGIDDTHPDLAGKVVAKRNFVDDGPVVDEVGHGTHVAATIAGSGAAAGGRYRGVAPDARIHDGKVCVLEDCPESAILAGMQWAAATQRAKVVNMSLGGRDDAGVDPLEQAVQNLTARHGTLFVIAAGNSGPSAGTLGSPGTADAALTVGAVDSGDKPARFSSRGPRAGDDALKPDITAPGVGIVAARSKDTGLPIPPTGPGGRYSQMSGTSMATPHVAGAAAIVAQQHPDWTPARLKSALMGSAKLLAGVDAYTQGAGRVDLTRAIRQVATAAPASVSFGRQLWPHNDDKPVTRTVTYHNAGSAPLEFALAVEGTAGLFRASAPRLTVPAGGDATVDVTADTRVKMRDGLHTGALVATAGDTVVRVPLAVNREVESYALTIRSLDRKGKPAGDVDLTVVPLDRNPEIIEVPAKRGTGRIRLERGRYTVIAMIAGSGGTTTVLAQPRLVLDRARTATMDGRVGRPVSVTVPRAGARSALAYLGVSAGPPERAASVGALGRTFKGVYSGQVGPANRRDPIMSEVLSQWGEVVNSPYLYLLAWRDKGRFPTGVRRRVTARHLAKVRADFGSVIPGDRADRGAFSAPPGQDIGGVSAVFNYDLPRTVTEYYNADGGVRWSSQFTEMAPGTGPENPAWGVMVTASPLTAYRPGRIYRQTWNRGVFGPSVAGAVPPVGWAARRGDETAFEVPMFADGAGRPGYSYADSAKLTVDRDGTRIVELPEPAGSFTLPAADGGYRVTAEVTRSAPEITLSTRVSATWGFRSARVAGSVPKALPLMTVRFSPKLNATNTAPAGRSFTIPVTVHRQGGAGPAKDLAVEASFDDGRTWRPVPVGDGRARVVHPDGHGYVSLKAVAADGNGNTVEQTVIRAYRF